MTTIVGALGALILGGAVGTFTLMGVVNNQTSPQGDSPANVSEEAEVSYGTVE